DALLVPQRAVEELQGVQSVLTVGPGNIAQARSVVIAGRSGANAIIDQGLKAGDRVIVEGLMLIRPGAPVTPLPWQPAARQAAIN
ncbi:MAG TPA: efflux RND transporter periplasmic adaptor subunit, partial [Bryobacteraceae bacterium]|nr:efflux RND transporter periplasmic adaptor subunit [Bryobacteraceae bacterium]